MADKKPIISLDPKVSMGHLLSIVMMLVAAVAFFQNMETKINNVDHKSEIGDLMLQGQVDQTVRALEYITDELEERKGR